jgi:hypothetical protein
VPKTSNASAALSATSSVTPEFLNLPKRGGDPIFGLSRSWWLASETSGLIRLVRLRKPGGIRGRVLIPVQTGRELIARLSATSETKGGATNA